MNVVNVRDSLSVTTSGRGKRMQSEVVRITCDLCGKSFDVIYPTAEAGA